MKGAPNNNPTNSVSNRMVFRFKAYLSEIFQPNNTPKRAAAKWKNMEVKPAVESDKWKYS